MVNEKCRERVPPWEVKLIFIFNSQFLYQFQRVWCAYQICIKFWVKWTQAAVKSVVWNLISVSKETILARSHETSVSWHCEFHCSYEFHINHEDRYDISTRSEILLIYHVNTYGCSEMLKGCENYSVHSLKREQSNSFRNIKYREMILIKV